MFIPILGNERETREGGGRRNTQGGDVEIHNFWDRHKDGRTDGQTDRGSYRVGAQLKFQYRA